MSTRKWKNVDELKTEHECDEHWNLRKLFILAHEKKFTEDRLLCLAQVFINVELMGCRYPQETMDLVASLSAELPEVQSFREKKRAKLQRTFVRASDAAATRAKGLKVSRTTTETQEDPNSERNDPKIADNPFTNIVILQNKFNESSEWFCLETVERTFNNIGYPLANLFAVTKLSNKMYKCDVMWRGNVICSVNSEGTERAAKCLAAKELLKIMKDYCYTVESLKQIASSTTIEKSVIGGSTKEVTDTPVAEENKGSKMLRMMGWTGGGLGKDGQGIADPVRAVETVNRSGLGLLKLSVKQSFHKIRKYLDKFLADESAFDLEFAADFTKEERAEIHSCVRRNRNLKTKSYGKDNERRLVVSKKERPNDMVTRLVHAGGSTEKHNLIWPLLSPRTIK